MAVIIQPAATITATYEELEGSPTGEYSKSGFTGQRRFKCPWAQQHTMAKQLKGSVTKTGSVITKVLPAQYPGGVWAHVESVGLKPFYDEEVKPAGGTDQVNAEYTWAELTVNFNSNVVDKNDDGSSDDSVLIEERITPWMEFLTLPPTGFRWKNGTGPALKEDEAPGKKFSGFTWVYSMTFVPTVPAAVADLIGKVNSAALTSKKLGFTFAKETLLYLPPELRRVTTTEGEKMWALEYRFQYKPQGHNVFWRNDAADGDKWQRIVIASTTTPPNGNPADPYEQGDFTTLITI
jgi:hypothetical protein